MQMLSVRSSLFESLSLIGMAIVLTGCCQLGLTCYELRVHARPELNNASIYLDDKLIKSSVVGGIWLKIPYGEHSIKVVQKGFKPFEAVLSGESGRSERALFVEFEPLDSVPPMPFQSDTGKTSK